MIKFRGLDRFGYLLSNNLHQSKRVCCAIASAELASHYQLIKKCYSNHRKYSRYSGNSILSRKMDTFKLSDYNCVGFDLDNTLLRYNITNMMKMEYEMLAKYMVEQKGYSKEFLYQDIDLDFMQKGLIVDFAHGNILRMGHGAKILNAAHGTRIMSDAEIVAVYGTSRKWEPTTLFHADFMIGWSGPLAEKFRTLLGMLFNFSSTYLQTIFRS